MLKALIRKTLVAVFSMVERGNLLFLFPINFESLFSPRKFLVAVTVDSVVGSVLTVNVGLLGADVVFFRTVVCC